jgi:serine/threonine protein kinase
MSQISDIFITESDFRNRYQYDENDLLGEGGFAQVYKAFDKQFQEYVALKFYSKGDQGKYDVLHEMKDTRKFSHPNIIRIHDAFVVRFDHIGGHSFVQVGILEFANGGNLRDFIKTKPSEETFVEVLKGILNGLEYLHQEKKLVHRDLSPENILMYNEEDTWTPKIADFGISKKIDYVTNAQDKTKSTQLLGKVDYMAPEQFYPEKYGINGKINTNVDLWSFGVILYELFTERKPFGNDSQDNPLKVIQSITSDQIPDLINIPDPYRTVIRKCLEKNANNRVKSASELISILQRSGAKKTIQITKTLPINDFKQKSKKKVYYYISALLGIVLFIAGYLIFKPEDKLSKPDLLSPLDPNIKKNELKALIDQKQYEQAITQIKQLPENIRLQKDIVDLYNLSMRSMKLDSLLIIGNQLFNRKDYNASMACYRNIINNYDPSNIIAKNRIDSINSILSLLNTPKKKLEGLYKKGMFSVSRYPKNNAIEIESIEITKTATIISLKLKAGESRYFSSPGNNGAFFIEYDQKKQRLHLKDITGVRPGTFVIDEKDRIIQLYFDRLPENVSEFDLINGDALFHKEYEYADFIGIKLK